MRHFATCLIAVTAAVGSTQIASAADMPVKAPIAAPAWNWSGLYIGLNGGYGWGKADHSFAVGGSGNDGANLFSPDAGGGSFSHNMTGGIFGLHLGVNQQWSNWVVGLEGSFDWSGMKASSTDVFAPTVPPTVTYDTKIKWFATVTPRLGYSWANWLAYLKGGIAAARVSSNLTATAAGGRTFSRDQDHIGWTIGAGVEYALTGNWILGLEYNYYDLGSQTYGGETVPNTTWPVQYDLHPTFSTVLARASYKFNGTGSGPYAMASSAPMAANWSGLYVGLNGGYGWGKADHTFDIGGSGYGGANLFSPDAAGGSFGHNMTGGVFGLHLGANQQWGNIVAGLEASFDWTDVKASSTDVFAPTTPGTVTYDTKVKWLATVTPRLGYSWANWLGYLKGGVAAARISSNLSSTMTVFPCPCTFSRDQDHFGWTLGGGVEYALARNWILGAEYNYYNLGTRMYGGEAVPNTTWPVQYSLHPTFSTVLARVSYKFGS